MSGANAWAVVLVVIPAVIGAFGTVVSIVVAARLNEVKRLANGRLTSLEEHRRAHLAGELEELDDEDPAAGQQPH